MFSKKIKEIKKIRQESEILFRKSQVLLSGLRKNFRKTFQDNLKNKVRKAAKLRFSEFEFGTKKNNQDAAIIYVLSVNDAEALDLGWVDEYGNDANCVVPFSLEWFEEFCRQQSEVLGINVQVFKKNEKKWEI